MRQDREGYVGLEFGVCCHAGKLVSTPRIASWTPGLDGAKHTSVLEFPLHVQFQSSRDDANEGTSFVTAVTLPEIAIPGILPPALTMRNESLVAIPECNL